MPQSPPNLIVVLGPTASGKTRLGVRLAHALGGEILSADSRQVYRGLDIGAGKDLQEYRVQGERIPYHLIDIADLDTEYSVFHYQRDFFTAFEAVASRGKWPVLVGGTGLYIEAVLRGYRMVEVPEQPELRAALAEKSTEELEARLREAKPDLHNTTDLTDRDRLIRAIEIAEYTNAHGPVPTPEVHPLVLGVQWPRAQLRERIANRLEARLDHGLVAECKTLFEAGYSWERLELLGLEYRFCAQYLQGQIRSRNDLFQKLNGAIARFAKRQETWFRRMERNGLEIHWISEGDFDEAWAVVGAHAGSGQ